MLCTSMNSPRSSASVDCVSSLPFEMALSSGETSLFPLFDPFFA